MSKHASADAQRPPSLPPPRPGLFRTPSRQAPTPAVPKQPEKINNEGIEDIAGGFEDAPPAKRRKIDSPTTKEHKSTTSSQEQKQDGNGSHSTGLRGAHLGSPAGLFGDGADPGHSHLNDRPVPTGASSPLPLPPRPRKHKTLLRESQKDMKSIPRVRHEVKVPTTVCKLENPDDGPFVQGNSVADFFPWVGNHPEDQLNDQTVKSGQFDKQPPTWNESNTARPALLNTTFKNRLGLQTLSALYGSAMQQRAQNQRITSGSVFKPPPRVTLTETKRKAWLSDLANDTVPLRKLSRTIPQGIRGQLLLEQCLTNTVPISRAIWFAKCVGANEIRTLKRKGTSPTFAVSAEAKWSKDWTTNIQQFIEALVKDCGNPDWRTNISYGLRLTTRLYSENLLDKDSFLDWILSSAENSHIDQLPVWLMILHINSKDLSRSRRRGGRMAALLVDKLRAAQTGDKQASGPLVARLKKFVRDFVTFRPACFLMPQKWQQCEAVLRQCLHPNLEHHQKLIEQLRRVNERVAGPMAQRESVPISPRQSLIRLLDAARAPYKIHQLAKECFRACEDRHLLLITTIEWSCTRFRHGEARLYLAVRLLRLWHRSECDLDGSLHEFLANSHASQPLHVQSLHHLIAELVRSRDFSVSKYLQWLTARGALRSCFADEHRILTASHDGCQKEIAMQLCDEHTQLLTEIPLIHLPNHVRNLRSTLLSRIGFDVDNESAVLHHCQCFITERLEGLLPDTDDMNDGYEYHAPDLGRLAWTIKSELGQWLRGIVATYFPNNGKASLSKAVPSESEFTLNHFILIRGVLERIGDISMLADVLCLASDSRDEAILASVADSINAHFESFSAIGALDELHKKISQAYVSLKAIKVSLPTLAISLLDLGGRRPDERLPVRVLQEDIARGDKINTIAAYSPFSDGMAESLQQAGSTFVEDFEAVILSEPNMTEQTMNQLFALVVERLQKADIVANQGESRDSLCLLLARLRVFRPAHFDSLMSTWIRSIVASSDNSAVFLVLALVNFSCLSISAIFKNLQQLQTDTNPVRGRHSRRNVAWLLCNGILSEQLPTEPPSYRFRTVWSRYLTTNPADALAIIALVKSDAMELYPAFSLKNTNWVPPLLSDIALQDFQRPLDDSSETCVVLEEALSDLFQEDCLGQMKGVDIQTVIGTCDDFSLPFCQLQLHIASQHQGSSHQASGDSIVDALFSLATKDPTDEGNGMSSDAWLPLAAAVNKEIACQLRERAEQAFFAVNLPLSSSRPGASPLVSHSEASIIRAARNLHAVSKMAYTIPEAGDLAVCSQLNEKLTVVWRTLNINSVPTATTPVSGSYLNVPPNSTPSSTDATLLFDYLPLLLRFACLHRGALSTKVASPLTGKQPHQDHVKILVLLACIALHPTVSEYHKLVGHVFDVMATLVDNISEEARAICARCLKDKMRDPRVNYLFGTMNTLVGTEEGSSSLQLVKEGKGVIGEWKVKQWELLEGGADTSLNLSLFQCRVGIAKGMRL
jgi:mediator of RNA polymerase II transcription subunit 12, fungi type